MSYVKVYKYKKQISLDNGVTWQDVTPAEYVPSGDPIAYYDTLEECMTVYRTVESTTCAGTYGVDKCEYTEYQVSYDNGETWSTYSAVTGSVIEYNSVECGYEPPKYRLYLNDSSIISASCDSTSAVTEEEISAYSDSIVSVEIGDCITSIGDLAFAYISGLTSVTLSDTITSIGSSAFEGCVNLTGITLPNSVTYIGSSAFVGCSSISSVTIPSGVTTINMCTFDLCTNLSVVNLHEGITSIGEEAFSRTKISSFSSPVTSIGMKAFMGCTYLSHVYIPNVQILDSYIFDGCTNLTSVDFNPYNSPSLVESPSVTIGNVTKISAAAFGDCSGLTSIRLPSTVTEIGLSAFNGCSSLEIFKIEATTPPVLEDIGAFYNTPSDKKIIVPCASVNAYKAATNWSYFSNKIDCKTYLFEGSQSFGQWQLARFSKAEGFLQVAFQHNMNGILDYLYFNNEPLYVEFSSVPESGTLRLQNGWWSKTYDAAAPVSTSEPLQIYITDNAMYNDIYQHDLGLIDSTGGGFTITKVYYYE